MKRVKSDGGQVSRPKVTQVMGIDELNLAEFPLSLLSDRARPGQKTLVFEDDIEDSRNRQRVIRRLTITGSDAYGLPTAMDDEVILGLAQVTNAAGRAERKVRFSRYELIRALGWRHEGKSYRRLETSLHRWLGVTLHYANAWRQRNPDCWVSESFHILDNVRLVHCPTRAGWKETAEEGADPFGSFVVWNDVVFRSLKAGHIKKLDMEFYRSLKSAVSKRMFRFLDKRFYQSPRWTFELKRFACEHIGLSRGYGCAELKRLLSPAILELEQLGFLESSDKASRFRQLRRGHWEVCFRQSRKQSRNRRAADAVDGIGGDLAARGVARRIAERLANEHPEEILRRSTALFDQVMKKNGSGSLKNPPGLLVQIVRNGGHLSTDGNGCISAEVTRKSYGSGRNNSAVGRSCRREAISSVTEKERAAIQKYLNSLPDDEQQRLEQEAYASAPRICRDGLKRTREQGKAVLAPAYHEAILFSYVRGVLGRAPEKEPKHDA